MNTVVTNSNSKISRKRKKSKSIHVPNAKDKEIKNIEDLISKKNETEIESIFYQKDIVELREKIIIYRIKKLRNESAQKIQNIWKNYKLRLKVHKLSHHVNGCYTIYPEAKDACKMYVKIFTNELKKEEFKILKLDFCGIRKCFVKDIPKNKFYTSRKIMYFNFMKNGKIFFDNKYEKVLYLNDYVHKVDFSIYDRRKKILDETIYSKKELFSQKLYYTSCSKDSNYLSTEDEKESSENSTLSPDFYGKNITKFSFSSKQMDNYKEVEENNIEYEGLRVKKRKSTNETIDNIKINRNFKRFESFDASYSCKSKLKSILRDSNCEELHKRKINMESGKKVSFGKTVYFY